MFSGLKDAVRLSLRARVWRRGHGELLLAGRYRRRRNQAENVSEREHFGAAVAWLCQAQERDGGPSAGYRLDGGWMPADAAAAGGLVSTFLALAEHTRDRRHVARARQVVDFLLGARLESGALAPRPNGARSACRASVLATAAGVRGLVAWDDDRRDDEVRGAAERAAEWLRRELGAAETGSFELAHGAAALAAFGAHADDQGALRAAELLLARLAARQDAATSWIGGFEADAVALPALGGALDAALSAAVLLRHAAAGALCAAAERLLLRLERTRGLAAEVGAGFRARARVASPAGAAAVARLFLRTYESGGDVRFVNGALRALDLAKAAQAVASPATGIRGGMPAADPVDLAPAHLALSTAATRSFVEALLEKERVLARWRLCAPLSWFRGSRMPEALPAVPKDNRPKPLRVVLYAPPRSDKCARMLAAWGEGGIVPAAVVIENLPERRRSERLADVLRDDGVRPVVARLVRRRPPAPPPAGNDVRALCRARGIAVVETGPLGSEAAAAAVRALAPDVAVAAGVGLLRGPLLDVPRLGTLNAHMARLPCYRGIDAAKWAALLGDGGACAVHLVAPGVNTGDLLLAGEVDVRDAATIGELWDRVDAAEIRMLGDVLHYAHETGQLPPRLPQDTEGARQFFRMHDAIAAILEDHLAAG